MNDAASVAVALEVSVLFSDAAPLQHNSLNEPVVWQQICLDRYKLIQLWVLQAGPRGQSKDKGVGGETLRHLSC